MAASASTFEENEKKRNEQFRLLHTTLEMIIGEMRKSAYKEAKEFFAWIDMDQGGKQSSEERVKFILHHMDRFLTQKYQQNKYFTDEVNKNLRVDSKTNQKEGLDFYRTLGFVLNCALKWNEILGMRMNFLNDDSAPKIKIENADLLLDEKLVKSLPTSFLERLQNPMRPVIGELPAEEVKNQATAPVPPKAQAASVQKDSVKGGAGPSSVMRANSKFLMALGKWKFELEKKYDSLEEKAKKYEKKLEAQDKSLLTRILRAGENNRDAIERETSRHIERTKHVDKQQAVKTAINRIDAFLKGGMTLKGFMKELKDLLEEAERVSKTSDTAAKFKEMKKEFEKLYKDAGAKAGIEEYIKNKEVQIKAEREAEEARIKAHADTAQIHSLLSSLAPTPPKTPESSPSFGSESPLKDADTKMSAETIQFREPEISQQPDDPVLKGWLKEIFTQLKTIPEVQGSAQLYLKMLSEHSTDFFLNNCMNQVEKWARPSSPTNKVNTGKWTPPQKENLVPLEAKSLLDYAEEINQQKAQRGKDFSSHHIPVVLHVLKEAHQQGKLNFTNHSAFKEALSNNKFPEVSIPESIQKVGSLKDKMEEAPQNSAPRPGR